MEDINEAVDVLLFLIYTLLVISAILKWFASGINARLKLGGLLALNVLSIYYFLFSWYTHNLNVLADLMAVLTTIGLAVFVIQADT